MSANLENSTMATGLEKINFYSNPKEKECQIISHYHTITLILHASKIMLKILQARLQQCMNQGLLHVQPRFRKWRGTTDKIASTGWIMEKAREFQKSIYFCFIDYTKAFDCVDQNKLWKIREMGITGHLTCLLRNLYAGQEATIRTGHGTMHWFKIGKGVHQGWILSPCLFNLCASWEMPAGWNTNWSQDCQKKYKLQICRWYHSNGRKWRGTEEPLDEGERGEWKSWLETQHYKN